jgi:TolB-like protein
MHTQTPRLAAQLSYLTRGRVAVIRRLPIVIILSLLGAIVGADSAMAGPGFIPEGPGMVLPVQNRTSDAEIARALEQAVYVALVFETKLIDTTPLRDEMRRLRLRQVNLGNPELLAALGDRLAVSWLLTVTLHEVVRTPVAQLAISAELFVPGATELSWNGFAAGTSRDGVHWLGRGLGDDIFDLTETLVAKLFESLLAGAEYRSTKLRFGKAKGGFSSFGAQPQPGQTIAIIPFDSVSDFNPNLAAEVVTSATLATLQERGFRVLFPGQVRKDLASQGRLLLGEIDGEGWRALHDQSHVDWILTGTLETYKEGVGIAPNPWVAFSARLIDAETGQIVWSNGLERQGTDSRRLFDRSRIWSSGQMTHEMTRSLIADLADTSGRLQP